MCLKTNKGKIRNNHQYWLWSPNWWKQKIYHEISKILLSYIHDSTKMADIKQVAFSVNDNYTDMQIWLNFHHCHHSVQCSQWLKCSNDDIFISVYHFSWLKQKTHHATLRCVQWYSVNLFLWSLHMIIWLLGSVTNYHIWYDSKLISQTMDRGLS